MDVTISFLSALSGHIRTCGKKFDTMEEARLGIDRLITEALTIGWVAVRMTIDGKEENVIDHLLRR